MLKTTYVLPMNVIIDWQLDQKSKLEYNATAKGFTTNNSNSIFISTMQEATQKEEDVAYELREVSDVRWNARTKK